MAVPVEKTHQYLQAPLLCPALGPLLGRPCRHSRGSLTEPIVLGEWGSGDDLGHLPCKHMRCSALPLGAGQAAFAVFTEYRLCAQHCYRHWGTRKGYSRLKSMTRGRDRQQIDKNISKDKFYEENKIRVKSRGVCGGGSTSITLNC